MMTVSGGRRRWRVNWISGLLLLAAGCADPPATAEVPAAASPVPADQARVSLYRDWEPSESLNLANIDVNGGYFGSVANGSAFYRDVPPGRYHIAPQSYGRDIRTAMSISLPARDLCQNPLAADLGGGQPVL